MQLRERYRYRYVSSSVQRPVNYGVGTFVRVPEGFGFPPRSFYKRECQEKNLPLELKPGEFSAFSPSRALSARCDVERKDWSRQRWQVYPIPVVIPISFSEPVKLGCVSQYPGPPTRHRRQLLVCFLFPPRALCVFRMAPGATDIGSISQNAIKRNGWAACGNHSSI
jgi:hypothetical protein